MNETVTVDEAIRRGHRMITYPVLLIILGSFGLSLFLTFQNAWPFWLACISFGASFLLAWLYWSIMIVKWRLWAFTNVRNVHELKKKAIRENLIWKDGNKLEKTEIRTLAQKKKWKGLQSKFERPDFFEDDPTIPPETIIYFSKEKSRVRLILSMFNIALGLFFLIILDNFVLGTIIFISGIYLSFKAYYKSINTTAQIVLNQKGIKTVTTRFFRWSKIEEEEVIKEASRRRSDFYLTYKHPEGNEKIRINDYTIGSKELEELLKIYRGRYNKEK